MASEKHISIKEAAICLGITVPTMRNWLKRGRVKNIGEGSRIQFLEKDILKLKNEIITGKIPYLRSRRNKRAISSNLVPDGYLLNQDYQTLADKIVEIASRWDQSKRLLLLLELYIRLLVSQGKIKFGITSQASSLVDIWLAGKLDLEYFTEIASDFYQLIVYDDINCCGLEELSQLEMPDQTDEDLLGLVYMGLRPLGSRNMAGSYYTPTWLVDQLITDSLPYLKTGEVPSIVDPCCGSGNFLLRFFIDRRKRLLAAGYSLVTSEQMIFQKIITGYDLDPIAVLLTKMNLSLVSECPELLGELKIFCRDTLIADTNDEKYDLIIGNPPWGVDFSSDQHRQLTTRYQTAVASQKVDSFALFIEWGMLHAKSEGIISYVLPESFLTVAFHRRARQIIIESYQIREVTRLGTVFPQVNAPVITSIIQNGSSDNAQEIKITNNNSSFTLAQTYFIGDDLTFNVLGTRRDHEIVTHLHQEIDVKYLRNNADFGLGIVTGNNQRYLTQTPLTKISEPVITGRNLFKYGIKDCNNYIEFQAKLFQQVAPESLYRAPEKLLYRFINTDLVFAYDDQQRLSLNSANIVIPRISSLEIKYILALLNSRVAQFQRSVLDSSVKVLKSHLENIPLVNSNDQEQKVVVRLVDKLMIEVDRSKRELLYEQIDQIIMDYYKLPATDQDYIRKKVGNMELLY